MATRETAKHKQAFEVWYKQGRDYAKTREVLHIKERTIYDWAKRFNWHTRADERDAEVERRHRERAIQQKLDMLERHAKLGQVLQAAGQNYFINQATGKLKAEAVKAASEATTAIKTGIDVERKAAGLPDWVAGIINASDEDLLNEYRELRAALSGQTPPLESDGDGTDPAGTATE